jgi:predicted DNA-binding protein with PD1-like motif
MPLVRPFSTQTVHVGRFDKGSDILPALEIFCAEHDIRTGWVQVMGAVSRVRLAFYDQSTQRYEGKDFVGAYEIVSGTGNISMKEGRPFAHLHMVLSDNQFQTVAGHVMACEVFAAEFMLTALTGPDVLVRSFDEATGLHLWAY